MCISRNKTDVGDAISGWPKAAKGALYSRKKHVKGKSNSRAPSVQARCYLPSVSGRLVAHAKNVGMNKSGTSRTLDPVPLVQYSVLSNDVSINFQRRDTPFFKVDLQGVGITLHRAQKAVADFHLGRVSILLAFFAALRGVLTEP